eukprot:CAMPEP_0198440376 /NCGR_PEP_ID=MMETSP1452-20131203/58586_1 /TAXON_ID=1181717 /ORGANISM="Synchroma pusillum, Strain CCMP3072" /LENGTH=39 /DNA_ID= /DNA_START= /DNA_END= /DNA_ORIENTATION=
MADVHICFVAGEGVCVSSGGGEGAKRGKVLLFSAHARAG